MAAALLFITIGGIMVYSAIEGISITDVLKGVTGQPLDPKGGSGLPDAPRNDTANPDDSPPATGKDITSDPLSGITGTTTIDGHPVANWIAKRVLWARTHGWTGQVTSGVRTDQEQCQACINTCGNCNGCSGTCAAPGESNHRGTVFPLGAVDVTNPAQFAQVISRYPGGASLKNDLPKDLVHFSFTGH